MGTNMEQGGMSALGWYFMVAKERGGTRMAQEVEVGQVRLRVLMWPGNRGRGVLTDRHERELAGESVGAVLRASVG